MTTARDAIFQNTPSPERRTRMDRDDSFGKSSRRNAEPADLIEIARRSLEEQSAEKQRAHQEHADVPQSWINTPGDTLDLSNQGARVLPLEVIDLIKDRIERLALSHNNQIFLPPGMALCSRLFYLNLRWNNLTAFPEAVLNLPNLQTLDLSRNRLTTIPEDIHRMTSLKFFAFTNNQITRLPHCFGDMASLTRLKMDDNPIQYPPPEEYALTMDVRNRPGFEPNAFVCGQVKRFLRRERQRQEMESEMSESNLETPKPLKRSNTGRFPVRPIANGDGGDRGDSMYQDQVRTLGEPPRYFQAPPIPQRSSARDPSLAVPPVRRPGLAPINVNGIPNANRSRSETVALGSARFKRQGYVPIRKTSGPPSATFPREQAMARQVHARNASYAPRQDGPDDVSSGTLSPADPTARRPWMSKSRLSSLPEDRRVSKITSPTIRSARLLVYSLDQLNRPVDDAIRIIRSESPRMTTAERLHFNATQNLKALDAQLHILTPMSENQAQGSKDIRSILRRSRYCVQAYHQVISELRLNVRKLVLRGDPMYLRALMLQIHTCLLEVRNACTIQEQTTAQMMQARFSQTSQPRSDRTVTPTQSRPNSSKRSRGAKIIASLREKSPISASFNGSLLSSASSRTTTMSSLSLATPRSAESFGPVPMSRSSSAMTSIPAIDSDEERQFEKIYLSLKQVCDLADQTLVNCRQDFFLRREGAARSMSSTAARAWALALNKCDVLMQALGLLKRKMGKVRLNDPSNKSREFFMICDSFFNAWFDLASEIRALGSQGLDIGSIKPMLRPMQRAIKDASHIVNTSSLVRKCLDGPTGGPNMGPASSSNIQAQLLQQQQLQQSQAGGLQQQSQQSQQQQQQQQQAQVIPPTPLSAALGPAAQATVPNTPGIVQGVMSPAEYFYSSRYEKDKERERERSDTVTSRYGNGMRGR